jgi:hypothetical protein
MLKRLYPWAFGALVVVVSIAVVGSSLDFQQCVEAYRYNEPASQHLHKGVAVFIEMIPTYRHCVGAYVTDKNAVITAIATIVIAIFTTILGIFTMSLAKSTRVAANAADRSARAAIALQSPIIRIWPDKLGHGDFSQAERMIEHCDVSSVTVSNVGTTKAFPKEIIYGWAIGDVLPDRPGYSSSDRFPLNCSLEADALGSIAQRLAGVRILEAGEWSKICGGNYLWFYCAIYYDDFMEERHSHGFCWRWSNTGLGMGWREDRTPAYNRKT